MNEFKDDTVYPVEASTGGNNAHCVRCSAGYSGSYCVCLHKIAAIGRGMPTSNPDCDVAIKNRTCEAIHMREQEISAGHAIYFVDRNKQRAFYEELAKRQAPPAAKKFGDNITKPSFAKTPSNYVPREFVDDRQAPKPTVRPVAKPAESNNGYADAINAAMAEIVAEKSVQATPATPATPITAPKPPVVDVGVANLSPLEAARRRMQQKQQTNQ